MTKKHFIGLADALRRVKPKQYPREQHDEPDSRVAIECETIARYQLFTWQQCVEKIADFCQSENSRFNRVRWMAYVNGDCGPNGGEVKGRKGKVNR